MACGDAGTTNDDNGGAIGKGDFNGKPKITVRGAFDLDLELDNARQCDVSQFVFLGAWDNPDDQGFRFPTMQIAATFGVYTPPALDRQLDLTGTNGELLFAGIGFSSDDGDGCPATVTAFANGGAGGSSSIVLEVTDCHMRSSNGSEIFVSGEFGCTGRGYDLIDVGDPPADVTDGDVSDDASSSDGMDSGDAVVDTAGPDTTPPPDPCAGSCADDEACVAGECVDRANNFQSSGCSAPSKACDAGEDEDCASDHVCVDQLCRRLSCQFQGSSCSSPTRPCEGDDNADCADDHVCVDGLCRRLSCQFQGSSCSNPTRPCDGDDNADCASDHVCVEGLCRRLACQFQSSNCYDATRPCDGDDNTDCASEHVCAAGLCRRLSCQRQSSSCNIANDPCDNNDDSDCGADNICADGLCRSLSCQAQSTNCSSPDGPCTELDDCPADHACESAFCKRDSCN